MMFKLFNLNNKIYDLVIIGGGASGMMAAMSCRHKYPDYSIAILDRTFDLGRKILVTGGGRCNVTNANLDSSLKTNFFSTPYEFIKPVFEQFGYANIVSFFKELGVEIYEEQKSKNGKIYPITNQAKTITSLFKDELKRMKIDILLNTECLSLKWADTCFLILANHLNTAEKIQTKINIKSNYAILAAGGKAYPALGSNGTGFDIAGSLGHRIISPVPSALPLQSMNLHKHLYGIKVKGEATSLIEGKEIKKVVDDILFTKYGLSGMAILKISREISIYLNRKKKQDCFVKINFLPGKNKSEVLGVLEERWIKRPEQSVEKSLYGLIPNKVSSAVIESVKISKDKKIRYITSKEKEILSVALTNTKIKIHKTLGWSEAEFTAGGVDTLEIKKGTLESTKQKNLFFCGEIIDVDGEIGGYNLSWCWSSGWVAGQLIIKNE